MSGTYTVSGNVLTIKVEASTYPNSEGTEQKRRSCISATTSFATAIRRRPMQEVERQDGCEAPKVTRLSAMWGRCVS